MDSNNSVTVEIEAAWVYSFRIFCEFYVIPTLFSFGLIFNSASLVVLFGSTLQLKKSLVILFSFLNVSDWYYSKCLLLHIKEK